MEEKLQKLDQYVYTFVINMIGFLKTLQKKGVENSATTSLAKLTNTFNKKFNDFYELRANQDEIKDVLTALIEEIKFILGKEFEDSGLDVIHEKADLLIDADKIKQEINKIF